MDIINKEKKDIHFIILADIVCFFVLLLLDSFNPLDSITSFYGYIILPIYYALLSIMSLFISSFTLIFEFKFVKKYIAFLSLNFILLFFTIPLWFAVMGWNIEDVAAGFAIIGLFINGAIASFIFLLVQLFSKKVLYIMLTLLIITISLVTFFKIQSFNELRNQHETYSETDSYLKKASDINEMVGYCNSLRLPASREDCFETVFILVGGLFQPPNYRLLALDNYPLLNKSSDISLENIHILCNNLTEIQKENDPRRLCK